MVTIGYVVSPLRWPERLVRCGRSLPSRLCELSVLGPDVQSLGLISVTGLARAPGIGGKVDARPGGASGAYPEAEKEGIM